MKEIELTKGKVALVDDEDYEWLNQYNWIAARTKQYAEKYYAQRVEKSTTIKMHRQIMCAPIGDDVDHKDRDGLNNQRSNLRFASHIENSRNVGPHRDRGIKGVYPSGKKWRAMIQVDGKLLHLGNFTEKEEAATAYDTAAIKYFGEFACTNSQLKENTTSI